MHPIQNPLLPLALAAGLTLTGTAQAAVIGYTTPAAFMTAVSAMTLVTEDFEAHTAGTTITSGSTLGGIGYAYGLGTDTLKVSGAYPTTSGTHFLGSDNTSGDLIFSGETQFRLDLGTVNAVGMYFVTPDGLADGDLRLTVGSAGVDLIVTDLIATLSDDSSLFFLGLVDAAIAFTQADISTAGAASTFVYNIDDILRAAPTGAAPLPGTALLLGLGLLGLARRSG